MHLPGRQRGLALLILMALFAVTAAYMLVRALNRSSIDLTLARAEKNRAVMQQAKASLIAWSASQALTATRPGSLPCPDRNNDGYAESSCGSSNRLGRLPYKTLGVDELRDASGELLWYSLSSTFRNYTGTINSDTQGNLILYDRDAQGNETVGFNNVVAVVLAPGAVLANQDRSWSGATCSLATDPCNTASNYLEGRNGDANTADYVIAAEDLTDAVTANLINDQLLAITSQDLFTAVEPVVAARMQSDIVRQFIYDPTDPGTSTQWSDIPGPNKSRYFKAWGGFPFAVPFTGPPSSTSSPNYTGQAATPGPASYEGLLPVVSNLNYTWNSGSVIQTGGTGWIWGGSSCTPVNSNTQLSCNIWYNSGSPTISISGTAGNVGNSFVQLPQLTDLNINCFGCSLSSRNLSGSLDSSGVGTVTLTGTLSSVSSWTNMTVTFNQLSVSAITSTNSADFAGWYNNNQWYKQTYYSISPGYAPGGAGSCNPWNPPPSPPANPPSNPPCLSVANLPNPPYANPSVDTRAIVILAGRSLSGATRPNGALSDYLEGKNASTGDYSFENSLGKTTTVAGAPAAINDRVIVIAP